MKPYVCSYVVEQYFFQNIYILFLVGISISRIPTPQKFGGPPLSLHYATFRGESGVFWKVVLGLRNFGYDFWAVWGDAEGDIADT